MMKKVLYSLVTILVLCLGTAAGAWSQTIISIDLDPANATLAVSVAQQYTATANLSDGSTRDVTSSVTWSSIGGKVATVKSGGLVTAKNTGSTIIMATLGAVQGSTPVIVTSATLSKISVSPST